MFLFYKQASYKRIRFSLAGQRYYRAQHAHLHTSPTSYTSGTPPLAQCYTQQHHHLRQSPSRPDCSTATQLSPRGSGLVPSQTSLRNPFFNCITIAISSSCITENPPSTTVLLYTALCTAVRVDYTMQRQQPTSPQAALSILYTRLAFSQHLHFKLWVNQYRVQQTKHALSH